MTNTEHMLVPALQHMFCFAGYLLQGIFYEFSCFGIHINA
jgi:hypothetical protein